MKITFKTFLIASFFFGGAFYGNAQTKEQREKIISTYDLGKLEDMRVQFEDDYLANKAKAYEMAEIKNWPLTIKEKDGSVSSLQGIFEDGTPMYYSTENRGATRTIRAHHVNSSGSLGLNIDGQNMIAGVWDGGPVRITHVDFEGRAIQKDGIVFAVSDEANDHATHVTGTIIANNANNNINVKSAAFQATAWCNDWDNDTSELVGQAAQGLLVSNHSYGLRADLLASWQFGAYSSQSRQWDQIAFNAPYLQVVKSAGNDRATFTYKGGYDLITGVGVSKNVMTIGAISVPSNNYTNAASVEMSSFSNWGPVDDGRVKPDIVAKGVDVLSTSSFSNTTYISKSGTSMSSPSVTGGLTLIQQYYNSLNNSFMRAATLKGLVVHTASEAGTADGPDYKFGWGLMDVRNSVILIRDRSLNSIIDERVLNQGATYTFNVTAQGGANPLVATISWTDPAGAVVNAGTLDLDTPSLVNDLDIKITKDGVDYLPWKLSSALYMNNATKGNNSIDNLEKVEIPSASGVYTVTITHKGTLVNSLQNYSLIISGIDAALGTSENLYKKFDVYPNPANDRLNISVDSDLNGDLSVEIFDILGKKVYGNVYNTGSALMTTVDVSGFTSGMYLVKVGQGGRFETKKIIKK